LRFLAGPENGPRQHPPRPSSLPRFPVELPTLICSFLQFFRFPLQVVTRQKVDVLLSPASATTIKGGPLFRCPLLDLSCSRAISFFFLTPVVRFMYTLSFLLFEFRSLAHRRRRLTPQAGCAMSRRFCFFTSVQLEPSSRFFVVVLKSCRPSSLPAGRYPGSESPGLSFL